MLEIDGTGLEGRFRDMAFEMDLAFVTRISGRELDAFDVALSGTELRLFNGAFEGEEIESGEGWWMTIAVPEGVTNLRPPVKTNAEIALSMRDTRAILAAFAEVNRWVHHFDRLLTVRDVAGTAALRIDGPRLSLRDIALGGHHFGLRGEIELRQDRSEGILWAERGPFSLGVERLDDENDFKLIDDREWYAEQHAAHWADR